MPEQSLETVLIGTIRLFKERVFGLGEVYEASAGEVELESCDFAILYSNFFEPVASTYTLLEFSTI